MTLTTVSLLVGRAAAGRGLFFLAPLYVMLVTSLKDAEQIRDGNLLSLPSDPTLESWAKAWSTACTGVDCRRPEALLLELGAHGGAGGADLHRLGRLNGYVLSHVEVQGQRRCCSASCCLASSCRSRWCCCR